MFASRLNNSKLSSKEEHRKKVNSVLDGLDLDRCADLKVSQLSGGQIKRVSIGVELISNPEILILDEPTSGLDSDNSENVIRLLKNLSTSTTNSNPPAIISTIHQPSYEVFNIFDQIYLLNKHGENVYFGRPGDMISYLCSFGFKEPSNVNPADYAIEIANGRFGIKQFEPMVSMSKTRFLEFNPDCEHLSSESNSVVRIENLKRKEATGFCFQFYMIFMRSMQAYLLKSPQTLIKTIMNILIAALVCSMWAEPLGPEPGCWSTNLDMSNATSETEALKNSILEAAASEAARDNYLDRISKITGNVNFIFMAGLYYIIVYTVGTVLIMPLEMRTVTKELSNSWYNVSAYFTAKTTCDIILLIMTSTIALTYNYFMTGQPAIPWRFAMFYLIIVIFCEVCESKGVLIGVVFNFDSIVATIVATTSIFPDVIFSGFMIKIAQIPFHYKFLTTLSHLRYSFEATLLTIYGFGRCSGGEAVKDFVDDLSHAQKSPLSMISTIWSGLNITVGDTRRFALLLGLEEDQLEPVVTAISDYLGPNHNNAITGSETDYDGETTTLSSLESMKEEKPYEASYVLSYFNIHDRELLYDVGVLLFMVFLLRLLTFVALSYKTKRQRL
jgi:energy-coupling factor transporter ATP-binding protein EcfA2